MFKHWLYPMGFYLLMALCLIAGAQWWVMGIVGLLCCLWVTGWGYACWLHRNTHASPLQLILDAGWISLVITWITISGIREMGLGSHPSLSWIVWVVYLLWTIGGLWLSRQHIFLVPFAPREKRALQYLFVAMVFLVVWKADALSRPLDGYWYAEGADDSTNQLVKVRPANFWTDIEMVGDTDVGAYVMKPTTPYPTLIAENKVKGRITLAVRGPLGSFIEGKGVESSVRRGTVMADVVEQEEEGAVPRYLQKGVAAISLWVDLQPDEQLQLHVQGEEVYLMASSDAVWAFHATERLRYTHYYQILNQVENQRWANEILVDRRFTWNQPPGWSPILALATILVAADMHGASAVFLHVLILIGLSSIRLSQQIAPRAQEIAWAIPAMLVLVHALLLLEPGSQNFPDSLYTASLLGVWIGLVENNPWRFAVFGLFSQALRWPGAILSTIFAVLHPKQQGFSLWKYLGYLWALILGGMLIAGMAMLTGDADDLLFILYFETFPEHWHGNANPLALIQRIPEFFAMWSVYTGGMLLLSIPFMLHKHNKYIFALLASFLGYGLLLGTIDHHPSHYFLPLVASIGPCFIASSTCLTNPKHQKVFMYLGIIGVVVYLWVGIV